MILDAFRLRRSLEIQRVSAVSLSKTLAVAVHQWRAIFFSRFTRDPVRIHLYRLSKALLSCVPLAVPPMDPIAVGNARCRHTIFRRISVSYSLQNKRLTTLSLSEDTRRCRTT